MSSTRRKRAAPAIKARTTMYRGIQMRSRLEADFAAFLDQNHADWDYEPVCFAGPDGQWLPDFRVRHGKWVIYFEVKPRSLLDDDDEDADPIDTNLERMAVTWLTEPDAILQLAFWAYGEPENCYSFYGIIPDNPEEWTWWCGDGLDPRQVMPWAGMGQFTRMVERVQREHEAAGGAS
jgi:hypothetical protein